MASYNLEKFSIPLIQKKTVKRTCKGPISIKRIDPKGEFIIIENTCIKKPIVLTNWTLKRRGVDITENRFTFDKHFVLHPNKVVKIFATSGLKHNSSRSSELNDEGEVVVEEERSLLPHELMSESTVNWGVGTYVQTTLLNHLNEEKASLLEKLEHYERALPSESLSSNNTYKKNQQQHHNRLKNRSVDSMGTREEEDEEENNSNVMTDFSTNNDNGLMTNTAYEFQYEKNILS